MGRQGKLDEAEALHRRLLETKQEALGPKHPDTLGAVHGLACHLFFPLRNSRGNPAQEGESPDIQSKLKEAEALYRRAVEGYREAKNEHMTREAMRNLAALLEIRGEAETAAKLRILICARWGVEGEDFEE